MAPDELDAIGQAFDRLGVEGRILDVGSRDVNGTIWPLLEQRGNYLDEYAYVGIDWEGGPNVDARASGHELPFCDQTFATVVCNSTLEHDPFFFLTVMELYRVAQVDATFVVGIPTYGFPYHAHPVDCYRATVDAFSNFILTGCTEIAIARVTDSGPPRLYGSGRVRHDWQQEMLAAQRRIPRRYEG